MEESKGNIKENKGKQTKIHENKGNKKKIKENRRNIKESRDRGLFFSSDSAQIVGPI